MCAEVRYMMMRIKDVLKGILDAKEFTHVSNF